MDPVLLCELPKAAGFRVKGIMCALRACLAIP
jgi:hypothetical protein